MPYDGWQHGDGSICFRPSAGKTRTPAPQNTTAPTGEVDITGGRHKGGSMKYNTMPVPEGTGI